jgi:hypothetical protein
VAVREVCVALRELWWLIREMWWLLGKCGGSVVNAPDCCPKVPGSNPAFPQPIADHYLLVVATWDVTW